MTTSNNEDLAGAVRLRHRQDVDRRDELRLLSRLAESMTQTQISKELRISQPAVNKALKAAGKVPDVREGFSGASPYEIAERYAAGQIDRAQLVDELTRWPYAEQAKTDGFGWLAEEVPATFEEVGRALDSGLVDDETYDAVLAATSGR